MVRSDSKSLSLDAFVIETPCPMDWDLMEGDERQRFCSRCEKHVFNIAEMTWEEATELISGGDKICGRIFRRPDGTIVTKECVEPRAKSAPGRFQFSMAALVTLLTASAGVFASAPWIGGKLRPIVSRWFSDSAATAPPPTACGPTMMLGSLVAVGDEDPGTTDGGAHENQFE